MLCVVPLLRALREKYPNAYIALLASPVNYDVMLNNRYVNRVINYDKREFLGKGIEGLKRLWQFILHLKAESVDLSIVPSTVSTSFTSDLLAYLSGASVRIGAGSLNGVENPSAFFFNVPVYLDWRSTPTRHQTERNLDICKPFQISTQNLQLEMTLDAAELLMANQLNENKLEQNKRTIVYHIGAGKVQNRWEVSRFARVANSLAQEFNSATILTSGPMDDDPVFEMIQWLNVPYNLIKGKSIREVATILSTADLVITNDTGIMHVAGAVGVAVLSLFGPTDPRQWAPIGTRNRYIEGKGGDINSISVEEVLVNAREMLTL